MREFCGVLVQEEKQEVDKVLGLLAWFIVAGL